MALDQATLEGLSGAEQIVVLKSLKQQGAAWLLNVTARTLRDHPEVPRNSDGSYDARELLTSGLQTTALPEVPPDEVEKLLQIGEWLGSVSTLDSDGSLLTAISLAQSLAERHGNAGLAMFASILLESWRDVTLGWGREPTETELREKLESEFRDRLDREQEARLRRQFRATYCCEHCKRFRRGREWVKGRVPIAHVKLETICPDCEKKLGPKNLEQAIEAMAMRGDATMSP